jgi:alkylhydroperoxidase family enzyme
MRRGVTLAPRIPPVTQHPPELDEIIVRAPLGSGVLRLFETLAHNPRLLKRFNVLAGGLVAKGLLPARERELIILRMAFRCNSIFEFGQHSVIGKAAGVSEDEIRRIVLPLASAGFGADDDAIIQMVDELVDANRVSDQTWDRLGSRWDFAELLELMMVAGVYWMLAGILNSAGVEPEPGVPGWPATAAFGG